jgi:hypothetical protein
MLFEGYEGNQVYKAKVITTCMFGMLKLVAGSLPGDATAFAGRSPLTRFGTSTGWTVL